MGYEEYNRGEFVTAVAENPAALRLPEEPFAGIPRYGYVYEDEERRRFASAGTLMEITAYDTKDRRTLQVGGGGGGGGAVALKSTRADPYPLMNSEVCNGG